MRFVFLLAGVFFMVQSASNACAWYGRSAAEAGSITASQRQLFFVAAGMALLGSGCIAAGISAGKAAGLEGFCCGLLGGPLGVIVAMFIDNRRKCSHCAARISAKATYCKHCQTRCPPMAHGAIDEEMKNRDGLRNSEDREPNQNQIDWMNCRDRTTKRKDGNARSRAPR